MYFLVSTFESNFKLFYMKRFFNFCAMLLLSISALCQVPVQVNEKMFVGFQREDGVFVIYDAKGIVTIKDGKFAERLETTELKLSKFLAITDFYETLDGARAKLGLPPITNTSIENHDYLLLNGTDDWKSYCPLEIAETKIRETKESSTFEYHHATHSILMVQDLANKGLQAKCNLKVEGMQTGIVYAETVQKMGAIRADMSGNNRFGNNHPMNRYGVGLGRDCVLKLPENETLKFTWVNVGDTNIEVWLHHPDPASKNLDFRQCISPGQVLNFEYNPGHYSDLPAHKKALKSNMNADLSCNRQ
jgi:hypothetical protein